MYKKQSNKAMKPSKTGKVKGKKVANKKLKTTRSGKAKPRHGVKGTRTHQNKGKLKS